ncbi:unnamed protein product [Cyprideis torosa]|uniref:Uncharacterized protein n=1 Tax=Cyprideis torosa TaxID=163714 RepID=A0A7R8ZPW2_9CRUS|nr:unnamed protein product [Cyprideis torosa]CAG0894929.1 unnamed protein product [Cyprideis torosa]
MTAAESIERKKTRRSGSDSVTNFYGSLEAFRFTSSMLSKNLSDVNGDGRMDLNEFSIACKLITMKLKGFEIPASLPPALRVLAVPAAPSAPGMVPPSSVPPASIPGVVAQQYSSSFTPPAVQSPPRAAVPTITSPPSASSQPGSRKHSDVGVSPTEWSVPHNTKLKYTMIFNQADHAKVGHLTGVQARPLLLQTQVAPMHLAKIWELSDIDSNGLLTCEEFVLAMYLTDCLKRGEHLPNKLPPDLVPPTFRKRSLAGTPGSQQSLSPVASQTNQGSTGHAPSGDPAQPVANGSGSNTPSSVFATLLTSWDVNN